MSVIRNIFGSRYRTLATLTGPRDAIQAVSFSVDGIFVSASGYGGITIWELATSSTVSTPHLPYDPKNGSHVYSSSAWLYFEGTQKHIFIVGNMAGQIFLWSFDTHQKVCIHLVQSQRVDSDNTHQVMSVDVYEHSIVPGSAGHIVTSTDDRQHLVSVWTLTSDLQLSRVFNVKLPVDFIPRIVTFAKGTQNVYAFSKKGGSFLQLQALTGELAWVKKDGPKEMHFVSVDERNDCFAAWTGQRAEVFKLSNSEYVKTFENEVSLVGNTKQVIFGEDGTRLMVGTDHGLVEVFGVESGQLLQRLPYHRKALVQYVTTLTIPSAHLVAIAGSTKGQPADVVVFKRKHHAPRSHSTSGHKDDNLVFSIPITRRGLRLVAYLLICSAAVYVLVWHLSILFY
ncbi:hypothetical protein K435DRAFT_655258 [Dendrothele bispora CBS 962.96]|uniref:Uncharacterized protein n=1 Tax=Dendrothele bispora (strain CBS 962.96) TaxID=1314807 RepID=A0A4S8MFQ3_DENBC|nr:hypothetical protein K435DRAFT_655258 [Dendrothele bispora CBS 962.96]